jgi:hypothetical protein
LEEVELPSADDREVVVLAAPTTEPALVEDDGELLSVVDCDSLAEDIGTEELGAAEFVTDDDAAASVEELVEDRVLAEEDAAALQPDAETLEGRKLAFLDRKTIEGLWREIFAWQILKNERICSRGQ